MESMKIFVLCLQRKDSKSYGMDIIHNVVEIKLIIVDFKGAGYHIS